MNIYILQEAKRTIELSLRRIGYQISELEAEYNILLTTSHTISHPISNTVDKLIECVRELGEKRNVNAHLNNALSQIIAQINQINEAAMKSEKTTTITELSNVIQKNSDDLQ